MTPLTVFITAADLDAFLGADEKTRLTMAGLTAERFDAAIADVNDEIAGAVGAKVLASVPKAFIHHGCSIARYRLHKDKATERMKADLDIAVKYFSDVQKGLVYLPLAVDPNASEPVTAGGWFTAQPSRFSGKAY